MECVVLKLLRDDDTGSFQQDSVFRGERFTDIVEFLRLIVEFPLVCEYSSDDFLEDCIFLGGSLDVFDG